MLVQLLDIVEDPERSHLLTQAIFMCHKNIKNTKFSCRHMAFLMLKMHQNPFSAGARSAPDPGGGAYDAPQTLPGWLGRGSTVTIFLPSTPTAS